MCFFLNRRQATKLLQCKFIHKMVLCIDRKTSISMSSVWNLHYFDTHLLQRQSKQSAAQSKTKCKFCTWCCCAGNDDINSVVSQCYSSYWGHESPYQLYYSQLMAIRLSSGQRSLHSSAEKKKKERDAALSFCFLIKFSLSPVVLTTYSLICPSLVLFQLNITYRTIHLHLNCEFNISIKRTFRYKVLSCFIKDQASFLYEI